MPTSYLLLPTSFLMLQSTALTILKTGANVFLTGEPGSGKTHTVNQFVSWLRRHRVEPAITASTGIAATHIGGITIHSWSGIGIEKVMTDQLMEWILENEKLVKRIQETSILIIDEISMLDARTLDLVDQVCKKLKEPSLPFGGLQVVFVGDFFQLPPVSGKGEEQAQFAFESGAWREADPVVCYLSEQYRQEDASFLDLLTKVRKGCVDESVHLGLRGRVVDRDSSQTHIRLYAHNVNVDRMNEQKLNELEGDAVIFEMESKGAKAAVERLIKNCLSPEFLMLKVGARVMCTKNYFEKGFVNGTMGDIVGFDDEGQPIMKTIAGRTIHIPKMEWMATDGTRTVAKVAQYPLRLAWAITIHKSQGLTLDEAVMDLSEVFEYGQGYVALSRVRSFSGLYLLGYNHRALQVHPGILERDGYFRSQSDRYNGEYLQQSERELERLQNDFLLASKGTLDEQIINIDFGNILKPNKKKRVVGSTYQETLDQFKAGKSIKEIAEARSFSPSTIFSHIEKLYMDGKIQKEELRQLCSADLLSVLSEVHRELDRAEEGRLSPVYEKYGGRFTFDELRLARMLQG